LSAGVTDYCNSPHESPVPSLTLTSSSSSPFPSVTGRPHPPAVHGGRRSPPPWGSWGRCRVSSRSFGGRPGPCGACGRWPGGGRPSPRLPRLAAHQRGTERHRTAPRGSRWADTMQGWHYAGLALCRVGTMQGWYYAGLVPCRGWVLCRVGTMQGWYYAGLVLCRVGTMQGWYYAGLVLCRVGTMQGWLFRRSLEEGGRCISLPTNCLCCLPHAYSPGGGRQRSLPQQAGSLPLFLCCVLRGGPGIQLQAFWRQASSLLLFLCCVLCGGPGIQLQAFWRQHSGLVTAVGAASLCWLWTKCCSPSSTPLLLTPRALHAPHHPGRLHLRCPRDGECSPDTLSLYESTVLYCCTV